MFSTKINEPLKKRLMNSIFNQLLNVKGAVVEDARIVGSPLRSRARARDPGPPAQGHAQMPPVRQTPARLRSRRRAASLEASGLRLLQGRVSRRHASRGLPRVQRGRGDGAVDGARQPIHQGFRAGVRVADDRRESEDRERVPARRMAHRGRHSP